MKKENKKLAQEQRAAQRKKEARKNLIKSIFTVGIPALAVVALVVLIIWDPFSKVTGNSLFTGSDTESTLRMVLPMILQITKQKARKGLTRQKLWMKSSPIMPILNLRTMVPLQ